MENTIPVSATTLELDEEKPQSVKMAPTSAHLWVEVVSIAVLLSAVYMGINFWREWFSSSDRVVFSVVVLIGLVVAFVRSDWVGECSLRRFLLGLSFFLAAAIVILLGHFLRSPKVSGIACGLVLAGWASIRILGESVEHSLSLGLAIAIPVCLEVFVELGTFDLFESQLITLTSGLADSTEQSHVREGNKLIFGLGVADQFSSIGRWDSVVTLFGIAVFCVLAFRRNLVNGALTIVLSGIVWLAVQAAALVTMAWLGNRNGVWYQWSAGLEIGLFAIAIVLVVSLDQFFSALLEPIPFEFINVDFPLFAYLWNWMCGLPTLMLSIPVRDDDFTELTETSQWEVEA